MADIDRTFRELRQAAYERLPQHLRPAADKEAYCTAQDPEDGYWCTRVLNHEGEHVAHGATYNIIKTWK